jgi:hypothetical protein
MTILPKGEIGQAAEGVESVMLDTESRKSAYFFDYRQKVPPQPEVSLSFGAGRIHPSIL